MANFDLHILGCGSATPSLRHLPACQVIDFRDRLMLVDCGEGAQLSIRRQGLKFSRITDIFISHLHGDHFLGLPGLLSTLSLHDIEGAVTVHTFAEGKQLLTGILDMLCRDRTFDLRFNIIDPHADTVILDEKALTVRAFPLYHRINAVGFRFDEKPKARHIRGDMAKFYNVPHYRMDELRDGADFITSDGRVIANDILTTDADRSVSYAYASDTMYNPRVADAVRGVDVLYHEATYSHEFAEKAASRGHSTARQAAEIARDAGVGKLVLGHFSKRYLDETPLVDEAREIFPNTVAANEGMTINIL